MPNRSHQIAVHFLRADQDPEYPVWAMAARLMRRILVDVARPKRNQKRGGEAIRVTFDEGLAIANEDGLDLVAINDALDRTKRSA